MSKLGQTKKTCANGHVMDPAWLVCPYCPSERRAASDLHSSGEGRPPRDVKTVLIEDAGKAVPSTPARGHRKTELMDRPPAIAGLAWLVGLQAAHRAKTHRIEGERTILGAAASCDVVIDHPHVSERHASLRFKDRSFVISDLDSANGTFVNGNKADQQPLADGDRIRLGSSEWIFKYVLFEEE